MPPADRPASAYGQTVSLRRRLASFAIAVLINTLLLLMLVFMSPTLPGRKDGEGRLTTFNLNDSDDKASAASKPKQAIAKAAQTATTKPAPKPSITPPIVPTTSALANLIQLTPQEFAAGDISKLPSQASAVAGGGAGDSGIAAGKGPHGEPLYAAEWYREPTDAQLGPYLPKTVPLGSWGDIACQTMPRFRVDNCVALDDYPPGLHLARAIQQAGWQFLVRPPRVGGKSLVGAWVRIRIEFTKSRKE